MKVTAEAYAEFVSKLFNRTGDLSKDFAHAVLGMTTEEDELRQAPDEVNRIEEAGDMLFFATAAAMVLREFAAEQLLPCEGLTEDESKVNPTIYLKPGIGDMSAMFIMVLVSGSEGGPVTEAYTTLQNCSKKWVGYDARPDAETLKKCLSACMVISLAALKVVQQTSDEADSSVANRVALANIQKLQHRYPGGFNLESAENRDREGERSALESAVSQ